MQKKRAGVIIAVLAVMHIVMLVLGIQFDQVGIAKDSAWWQCLTYHFFHANVFHLIINSLCLYSLLQRDVRWVHIVPCFLIAAISGLLTAKDVPTVGASAFIVALSGVISSWHPTIKSFALSVLFLTAYCLVPNINGAIHLVAWIGGYIYGRGRIAYLKYNYDRKGNHIGE